VKRFIAIALFVPVSVFAFTYKNNPTTGKADLVTTSIKDLSDIGSQVFKNASSGTVTVTLNGLPMYVVKTDKSANPVKIVPDGSKTIQGASEYNLYVKNESAAFRLFSSTYYVQ
jgi:hypothetical protein